MWVNDVHSRLNRTRVAAIVQPRDLDELKSSIRAAADRNLQVSTCGGRHAMGGQQFGTDTLLIDTTALHRILRFDPGTGLIEIEAGADWPKVIAAIHAAQPEDDIRWGIRQKQTGADSMTLGGSLSANVHGRGLLMGPIVDDIEAFDIVSADGQTITCSRQKNCELFALAIGGYGLFGVIASVTLRLGRRQKLRRRVDILDVDEAIPAVRRRVEEGCTYGDFQYAIDASDDAFLRRGVCACYQPVDNNIPISDASADLKVQDWIELLGLAHTDKRRAFEKYSAHYLATHNRVYWSDTMQLSTYISNYSELVNPTGAAESLVIGEQYVPPDALPEFLSEARRVLRSMGVEDIYGTIRAIRRDDTTFLRWARRDYACVIFNLRTPHDQAGIDRTACAFRGLNDAALAREGNFYLTYHRFASRAQIEKGYPQIKDFLRLKRQFDYDSRFTSDWYRHLAKMFE